MQRFGLGAILVITVVFAFYSPSGSIVSTPSFWRDEAIPFEISRTFIELGKLDVVVAPGVVDGRPYLTHASGFPLTVPLAGFMSVLGIGVLQARVFMIIWVIATIVLLFFILREFLGFQAATAGALLVATFASFYANGRTMTGEIPGLFFLLLALLFLYRYGNYYLGGFLLALCAVTKPSMYLLVFPVVTLEFLFFQRPQPIRYLWRVAVGALPVILLWIWIILPHPFTYESWQDLFYLYRNPFHSHTVLTEFPKFLIPFLLHSTTLYFSLLAGVIASAWYFGAYKGSTHRLLGFVFFYAAASVVYFLRSPGWFRFLLASQVLILSVAYPALVHWSRKMRIPSVAVVFCLVALQVVQYFFLSNIPSGSKSPETGDFINTRLLTTSTSTVGFIYMPSVAPLIPSHRRYQVSTIGGDQEYGRNPLALPEKDLPTYIMSHYNEYGEYWGVIERHYIDSGMVTPGGIKVLKRK